MLYRIARLAIAAPRRVIAVAVLVTVGTAIFGIPVITSLTAGGWGDPGSESARASAVLVRADVNLAFAKRDNLRTILQACAESAVRASRCGLGTDLDTGTRGATLKARRTQLRQKVRHSPSHG